MGLAVDDVENLARAFVVAFEARFKALLPEGYVRWCAEHETLMTAWHFTQAHDEVAQHFRRQLIARPCIDLSGVGPA